MTSTYELPAGGDDCPTGDAFSDNGEPIKPLKPGGIPDYRNMGVTIVNLGLGNFGATPGNLGGATGPINFGLGNQAGGTVNVGLGHHGLADRLSSCFGPFSSCVAALVCSLCSWVLEFCKKSCADHRDHEEQREHEDSEVISEGDGRQVHVTAPPMDDPAAAPEEVHEEVPGEVQR